MRKYYLDNIRYGIVILVVMYHVIYIFNSVGIGSNISLVGIPLMDTLLYFVYPWFMPCLFLVSGISARFALQRKSGKQFAKERATKLLIPSFAGILALGWISGYITSLSVDIFGSNGDIIPGVIKYLIYAIIGMGPLWFAHELFLASMILLLIRVIDKKDRIWEMAGRANIIVILLLFFAVWGSSQIFNTPVITVYRNGIYVFLFLLGYYLFSHDRIQDILKRWHRSLLVSALICGAVYTFHYYGDNYTSDVCLQSPYTNIYLWLMTLTVLGCGKAWFNVDTKFTRYMAPRSFGIYVLHYPILVLFAYLLKIYTDFPALVNYGILLLIELIAVLLLFEIINRIPVVSFLLIGKSKKLIKPEPI